MAYNPGYAVQGQYPGGGQYQPSEGHYPPVQGQYPPAAGLHQQQPNQGQYQPPPAQYQQQTPQMPYEQPPQSKYVQQPATSQQPTSPYPQHSYANKQSYPPSTQNQAVQSTAEMKTPWNPSQATAYSGPDISGEDFDENGAEEQVNASAPSYDLVISGYENVGSDGLVGPPPPYEDTNETVPAMVDSSRVPAMSAEVAREALLKLVAKGTCWGRGAARDMDIKDIRATCAYHYILETFTEGRSTQQAHVPYRGGYVDGPNGHAPLPWDIPCGPTALFKTEQHKIAVPHTEVVRPCHLCFGRGFNRCTRCRGRGRVRCGLCSGSGWRHVIRDGITRNESCSSCNGRGRKHCHPCHGSGCITCVVCSGFGSIKQFIELTVSFTNRHSDHIIERTDLPDELIRNVEGDTIFEQTLPRVGPIENFFETEVNHKSREMVNQHAASWRTERVLQQRHYLRAVPVHECYFEFKDKLGRFWVYGHDKEVYTNEYPHTCCCCRCTIL